MRERCAVMVLHLSMSEYRRGFSFFLHAPQIRLVFSLLFMLRFVSVLRSCVAGDASAPLKVRVMGTTHVDLWIGQLYGLVRLGDVEEAALCLLGLHWAQQP